MARKIGVLLVNLGTPDSPGRSDVWKYLNEFLTDGRVIDIPWIPRQILVRGFIGPFRSGSSSKIYKELWSDEMGSPLLYYGKKVREMVDEQLNGGAHQAGHERDDFKVELAMRYQSPSIENGLEALKNWKADKIIVFPMFPQYASASTGSVHQKVMELVSKWWEIPDIAFINSYYDNAEMVRIFADNGREHGLENYDHILFSYHGLPQRQLKKADDDNHCLKKENCCLEISDSNKWCYSAQCHGTTKALVADLGLKEEDYTVCFQSRLGRDPWVQPYTSDVIEELAKAGKKNILCFCPAFVADCLETTIEVSVEYQEEFEEMGGEKMQLVKSLNDDPAWIDVICQMVKEQV